MNNKEIRWKQRFENLEKAFMLLERAIEIDNPSETEKGGIIQFYEVSFELSWKIMKDYLESKGFTCNSPREAIKRAFQSGLLDNGEEWINALNDRNLTTHTYNEKLTEIILNKIQNQYFKEIKKLYLKLKKENEE